MEINKRINISADTSSISMLRNEVSGLTEDVNKLNRVSSATNFDSNDYSRKLEELRKQVENFNNQTTPIAQTTILPEETSNETETSIRKIEPSRTETNQSSDIERNISEKDQIGIHLERIISILESVNDLAISRNSILTSIEGKGKETTTESKPEEIDLDWDFGTENLETNPLRRERGESETSFNVESLISNLMGISNTLIKANTLTEENGNQLRSILENISTLSNSIDHSNGIGDNFLIPPSTTPPTEQPLGRTSNQQPNENSFGQTMTGVTSTLVNEFVDAMRTVALSRNSYEEEAGMVGVYGSAAGGVIGSIGNAFGPAGGAIGGIVGGLVSGLSSLISEKMKQEIQLREQAESNTKSFSQLTGLTINESISQGYKEGSGAASNLGLNVGEYIGRRADLLKASGGKVLGKADETETGAEEADSILAAQRKFGISERTISSLEGNLRFAKEGTVQEGSSSNSASAIIRLFENSMRELKLPFTEIAATIEESLETFNQTASNILDKAGEVDTGKIASILTSIRTNTGMEGRQLERVQKALTGQEVSKDATSQALLIQSARDVYPEIESYPELMAAIEKMGEDKELQKDFLTKIQEMSGGNEAQLQSMLKHVFPNLSWTDVVDLSKGEKDLSTIFDNADTQPEVGKGNEKKARFKLDSAKNTVGDIEAATKERENEKIGMPTREAVDEIRDTTKEILDTLKQKTVGSSFYDPPKVDPSKSTDSTLYVDYRNHSPQTGSGTLIDHVQIMRLFESFVKAFSKY